MPIILNIRVVWDLKTQPLINKRGNIFFFFRSIFVYMQKLLLMGHLQVLFDYFSLQTVTLNERCKTNKLSVLPLHLRYSHISARWNSESGRPQQQ